MNFHPKTNKYTHTNTACASVGISYVAIISGSKSHTLHHKSNMVHPRILTCPLNRDHLKRTCHLLTINFQGICCCHPPVVFFPGCLFGMKMLREFLEILNHIYKFRSTPHPVTVAFFQVYRDPLLKKWK